MRLNGCPWKVVSLGDHVDLLSGFAFKSRGFTDNREDVPLVKGSNVHQGFIDWDDSKYWPKDDTGPYERYFLEPDDVVLAMDRPWIEAGLKYSWIKAGSPKALLVQRVCRLRGKNGLTTQFLRYVIGSPAFTDYIKPIVTGVNVPHISGDQIRSYRFPLPPLSVQVKAVEILSAYDNLIENNTRRIAVLEQMARALYQEWFIRFRFPGHENISLVTSPLGNMPQGWSICPISALVQHVTEGTTPSQEPDGLFQHYSFPNYDSRRLPAIETGASIQSNKFKVAPGCVLISKLNPRIPRIWLPSPEADPPAVASTEFLVLIPVSPATREWLYCMFWSSEFYDRFSSCSVGTSTSHQRVKPSDLLKLHVALPDGEVVERFTDLVSPILGLVHNRRAHTDALRKTRDLLLPKLISGQIDLEHLDIDTGASLVEVAK